MNKKIFGILLIVLAFVITASVVYHNSHRRQQTVVYSTTYMLDSLWANYKKTFIDSTNRTIDPERQNITTSEGESYTMLRAVWEDDKTTFDNSWQWTQTNLKRPGDHLFAWLYGQTGNGSYGILTSQGGENTASDADSDIALALVEASSRWQDSSYLNQAQAIINDIWNNEVVTVKQIPYMTADNLEKNAPTEILMNPSYLSPAAYKIFAQVDPSHNWNAVVNSSYDILESSSSQKLNASSTSANLPPDWVAINLQSGQLSVPTGNGIDTNFGFDALRVPFRLALDSQWNHDPRDIQILQSFSFLSSQWQSNGLLHAIYGHDGSVNSSIEAPAMYGGTIGYFMLINPQQATAVYNNKLLNLYSPDTEQWKQQLSYYDSNWAWFGMALYNNRLDNYYQTSGK